MRKIAYIANSRVPSRAANTVHVLNMAAALAGQGGKVLLLARGEPADAGILFDDFGLDPSVDLALLPLGRPGLRDKLRFVMHVRRELARNGIDFAYGRSIYGLLFGVPPTIPLACDLHAWPASRKRQIIESLLFRRSNFSFATCITQALADKYASTYPDIRDRLVVAPCAANLPERVLPDEPRQPNGRPLRVYYVGHLYPGRGIDLILALAMLEPDLQFHIVGGEDSDIAEWAAQASSNVIFHGYVRPAGLAAHYAKADICIAPLQRQVAVAGGRGDTSPWMSPMKLFEYMAFGKPVIVSDLPVIHEVVAPGIDGLLCPPEDVTAWQRAIRLLHGDRKLRERLGEAARRKVSEQHTWARRAARILAEFESRASGGKT